MTRHRDDVRLRHVLDYARDAVAIAEGRSASDLDSDRTLRYALLHVVCIIGEAAERLSHECRSRHSDIPWNVVIGMRNRLIHGYDVVDVDILWDTVVMDLPALIVSLEKVIEEMEGS